MKIFNTEKFPLQNSISASGIQPAFLHSTSTSDIQPEPSNSTSTSDTEPKLRNCTSICDSQMEVERLREENRRLKASL